MSEHKIARQASEAVPFSVPFDDTTTSTTVLSTLQGPHSIGCGILGYFTMKEANTLRQVCTEMRSAVAETAFDQTCNLHLIDGDADFDSFIRGSTESWRKCFPKARAANLRWLDPRYGFGVAPNYSALTGIETLKIEDCALTDDDFVHFNSVKWLHAAGSVNQNRDVRGNNFMHLENIEVLLLVRFANLLPQSFQLLPKSLKKLDLNNSEINDGHLQHLGGIEDLSLGLVYAESRNEHVFRGITDAGLRHLKSVKTLRINGCTRVTGSGFEGLKLEYLEAMGCSSLTSDSFRFLGRVKTLKVRWNGIMADDFVHLENIKYLDIEMAHVTWRRGGDALENMRALGFKDIFKNLKKIKMHEVNRRFQEALIKVMTEFNVEL